MRKRFIAVCVPYVKSVPIEWAGVLRAMAWPLNTGYINFFVQDDSKDGYETAEGRNRCVQLAMQHENETREISHLFWLDDDVIAHPFALLALLAHNRPIASGVYFTRCDYPEPLIFPCRIGGTTPFVPDQAFETWGVGSGLTLVQMGVYRKMLAAGLPNDKYGRPAWYVKNGAEQARVEDGMLDMGGTEDLHFCDNAGKLGFTPFVDTSRVCFGWHVDRDTGQGYPKKQWEQRRKGQPIVWDTADGPKQWGEGPLVAVADKPVGIN